MFDGLDSDLVDGLALLEKNDRERQLEARPEYPHADCAVCVHWDKREGKCLRNRDPKKLGPYQACMYCNTDPNKKPEAKPAQTQKLF